MFTSELLSFGAMSNRWGQGAKGFEITEDLHTKEEQSFMEELKEMYTEVPDEEDVSMDARLMRDEVMVEGKAEIDLADHRTRSVL